MGLFTRRPQVADPVNFVSVGMNRILLIVGLGNVGKDYDDTRHNIGFACLDQIAKKGEFEPWVNKKNLKCELTSAVINEIRVYLIKPTTFMNISGEAVQAVQHFYKFTNAQTLVIHDELDIAFGQIRTRVGGESAGHNGVKSISQLVGEDYGRLKIGIGPKKPAGIDSADFVLQKFSARELAQMPNLLQEARAMTSEFIYNNGKLTPDTRNFIV